MFWLTAFCIIMFIALMLILLWPLEEEPETRVDQDGVEYYKD